jgi:NAD+ synthase
MPANDQIDYAALADEIASWLREHMKAAGAVRLVFGQSGGIDSAVVCALCTMATGASRVIPAVMPIHSHEADVRDAELIARTYEVIPRLIDLAPVFDALVAALPLDGAAGMEDANVVPDTRERQRALADANIKPRLRMTALYALANRYNGVVVGTGNNTELSIGYFTKYGDGGVDLLGDLDKTAVRSLARELGVPEPIIGKPPSAGLSHGQTDEAEIGLTYEQLDRALMDVASGSRRANADAEDVERIASLIAASEHKRRAIPIFRLEETIPRLV